ncbi:hypothetical protein N9R79_07950 [Vibrio sp.]|nr:hypothetical protein [Vibrio sp.]
MSIFEIYKQVKAFGWSLHEVIEICTDGFNCSSGELSEKDAITAIRILCD